MSERLRNDAWADVYLDRAPSTLGQSAQEPVAAPTPLSEAAQEGLDSAVAEAQDQARALREAVGQAEAILESCRELLDALRAILTYPSAYGWEKDAWHLSRSPATSITHPSVAPSAATHPASGLRAS